MALALPAGDEGENDRRCRFCAATLAPRCGAAPDAATQKSGTHKTGAVHAGGLHDVIQLVGWKAIAVHAAIQQRSAKLPNRSPSQPGHDSPFKVRIHPLDKGPAVVTRLYRSKCGGET